MLADRFLRFLLRPTVAFLFLFWTLAPALAAIAQPQIVDVTVHSDGLDHNLLGDPADQNVSIVLPAAYAQDSQRRFAVLYFLHGFSDPTPRHQSADLFAKALDPLIAAGAAQPFIIVLPNGINKYRGSFYINSPNMGNADQPRYRFELIIRALTALSSANPTDTHITWR